MPGGRAGQRVGEVFDDEDGGGGGDGVGADVEGLEELDTSSLGRVRIVREKG